MSEKSRKFWSLTIAEPGGCWIWQGPRTGSKGYGALCADRRMIYAHRYSYELFRGEIPPGHVIMHTCDEPWCVNPDHLEIGTQRANIRDCIEKDRWMTDKRKRWLKKQGEMREPNGQFASKQPT